jgi:hypothetical protein
LGFISNQWLNRGIGLRARDYRAVPVKIVCQSASTQRPPGIKAKKTASAQSTPGARVKITARKSGGEYQIVFLTQEEIDLVAEFLVSRVTPKARERLLGKSLGVLSPAKFLRVLAFDLRNRVKPE